MAYHPGGIGLTVVDLDHAAAVTWARRLARHITQRPPIEITLPWKTPDGPPVTATLLFYSRERKR